VNEVDGGCAWHAQAFLWQVSGKSLASCPVRPGRCAVVNLAEGWRAMVSAPLTTFWKVTLLTVPLSASLIYLSGW
jgi:hypothetical protein